MTFLYLHRNWKSCSCQRRLQNNEKTTTTSNLKNYKTPSYRIHNLNFSWLTSKGLSVKSCIKLMNSQTKITDSNKSLFHCKNTSRILSKWTLKSQIPFQTTLKSSSLKFYSNTSHGITRIWINLLRSGRKKIGKKSKIKQMSPSCSWVVLMLLASLLKILSPPMTSTSQPMCSCSASPT